MRWIRIAFRWSLKGLALLLALAAIVVGAGWWYLHPSMREIRGVVYGQRRGHNLTMDVLQPVRPTGVGVVMVVSGSWKSNPSGGSNWIAAPFVRQGQTVFAVCHVSQPEATVMEIVEDMHRAVRFIRHHAGDYGIDPARLGVTGGSSGGHLSLMLATCGGPGGVASQDPIDRGDSSVQAAAVFFPVTDLLNLGPSTENPGDGGPPIHFVKAFGAQSTDPPAWQQIGRNVSPIYHVTPKLPPILIEHGDADTLVPLDQSIRFCERARASGCDVELVVEPGCKHGWLTMLWDVRKFALWFDRRLIGIVRRRFARNGGGLEPASQPGKALDGWLSSRRFDKPFCHELSCSDH